MKKRAEELGCQIRTSSKVTKIISEAGTVKGVMLSTGEIIFSDYVVTTADPKVAMKDLLGMDVLSSLNKKYACKTEKVKMSASSFTISLGINADINLHQYVLDCGYNVITTGGDTFENLYKSFDKNEFVLNDKMFHCAVICPSLTSGGKNVLIIRVVPAPMANWKILRESDYESYTREKEKVADFYIEIVERYLIPDLKKYIVYRDIASPATFERYTGTPTGSNYDMAPYPDNFGLKRLKTRTPVKNLFQPKFSHGIWPSIQGGMQPSIPQSPNPNSYLPYTKTY